ncbi:MAG: PDGLE domain-containing protein [Paenibacillaceae bacterium]
MRVISFARRHKKWIVLGFVTLIIAVLISPFASSHPDGLQRVAEDHGFIEEADSGFTWSPISNYEVNIPLPREWRVALSGAIGLLIMGVLLLIIGKLLVKKRDSSV